MVTTLRRFKSFSFDPGLSFSAVMDLYSVNYRKFNRLLDVRQIISDTALTSEDDPSIIYIRDVSHARYTSTCKMSYIFKEAAVEKIPDARIKFYHDSRQLEALAFSAREEIKNFTALTREGKRGRERKNKKMPNLSARWQLNNFIYLWLDYCQLKGYVPAETKRTTIC